MVLAIPKICLFLAVVLQPLPTPSTSFYTTYVYDLSLDMITLNGKTGLAFGV